MQAAAAAPARLARTTHSPYTDCALALGIPYKGVYLLSARGKGRNRTFARDDLRQPRERLLAIAEPSPLGCRPATCPCWPPVSAGSMPSTLNLLPAAATVSCVQLESGVSRESAAAIAAAPEHLDGLCRSTGVLHTGCHRRRSFRSALAAPRSGMDTPRELCHAVPCACIAALVAPDAQAGCCRARRSLLRGESQLCCDYTCPHAGVMT